MQITKKTIKLGNSAGVLLPKAYLNMQVKITLEPLSIQKDVLEILMKKNFLKQTRGIYLTGSYARKEQTIESDIDILVITSSLNKRIKEDKYEIICISEKELKKELEKNALPLLPMLKEAKPISNEELIKKYKTTPLTKQNMSWHIKTTESAIKVIKKDLSLSKELKQKTTSDEIAYSLILRLRTLYIIDQINKNKTPTKRGLLNLIKKITKSQKTYEGYIRAKNSTSSKNKILPKEVKELTDYIISKLRKLKNEQWKKEINQATTRIEEASRKTQGKIRNRRD